jgi:hypothetical protein
MVGSGPGTALPDGAACAGRRRGATSTSAGAEFQLYTHVEVSTYRSTNTMTNVTTLATTGSKRAPSTSTASKPSWMGSSAAFSIQKRAKPAANDRRRRSRSHR